MGMSIDKADVVIQTQSGKLPEEDQKYNDDFSVESCDLLIKSGLFPSMDIIKEKIESETEVMLSSYAWFIMLPLFFMSLYTNKIYGVDLNMQLILLPIIAVCILDVIYIRIALIIDIVWDIYIKNQRDYVFDRGEKIGELEDMPTLKLILLYLKFILLLVFLVVRHTIIVIPYTVFKDDSTINYEVVLAFLIIFELTPIFFGLFDIMHTSGQKDMDMSTLNQPTDGKSPGMFTRGLMSVQEMTAGKKQPLRIFVSLFLYYPLIAIACLVVIATSYDQKMPNEQALKLPMFFAY